MHLSDNMSYRLSYRSTKRQPDPQYSTLSNMADAWAEPVPEDSFGMPSNCSTPSPEIRIGRRSCSCDDKSSSNFQSHWTVKGTLAEYLDRRLFDLVVLLFALAHWMEFRLMFKVLTSLPRLETASLRTNIAFLTKFWFYPRPTSDQETEYWFCLIRWRCFIVVLMLQVFFPLHSPSISSITFITLFCITWWGISIQNYLACTGCELLLWSCTSGSLLV
jgi:hypothetical protein